MSASNKKKIRKEQETAFMTERQRMEAKEQKKLKTFTVTFWVVMALCVCIILGTVISNPIKNVIYKNTTVVTVGDHELNAVTLNYFYMDAVSQYATQMLYASYFGNEFSGNMNTPLNELAYNKTSQTWADHILDAAIENIKSTYAMIDLAEKNDHKLTEDEQKTLDDTIANIEKNKDAKDYLRTLYGNGASVESYIEYYRTSTIANSYYNAYQDSLEYTDETLRTYEKDIFFEYSSYTFSYYELKCDRFYPEGAGKKDDKGNITYTTEEKKAAAELAKKAADLLASGEYKDLDAFKEAIKEMPINKDTKDPKPTEQEDILFSKVNSLFQDWIIGKLPSEDKKDEKTDDTTDGEDDKKEEVKYEERKEGDLTVIAKETGTGDNKVATSYYIVRYQGENENKFNLKNVRHVLLQFENDKPTTSEKNKLKAKAQLLLDEWMKGDKTEESFIQLAKDKSEDGNASTGGLYENVYPGQMVESFEDWCYDADRKPGDTGIVESTYGYHIMYFVGDAEDTYRDYMIKNELRADDMEEWHKKLVESMPLDEREMNTKYVGLDLTANEILIRLGYAG